MSSSATRGYRCGAGPRRLVPRTARAVPEEGTTAMSLPGPTGTTAPAHAPRSATGSPLPGLTVAAAATGLAFLAAHLLPALNPATVAVALGALAVNAGLVTPGLSPGLRVASHRLLRIAVVLLGLQLSLARLAQLGLTGLAVVAATVTATFVGTQLLGRLLGVPPARALLVATGFSICGASAVAAMEDVAGGDEEDTSIAVALVTLCGTLAILLLPALRVPLGLDPSAFGSWVGASVHDVGQTVATASRVPGALPSAVVVKLSRVVLLAPLVALVGLRRRHALPERAAGARRPPVVPLFVLGFLASILLASTGRVPAPVLAAAAGAQTVLLTAALFGLGTGIHVATLRRTGGRSLVLGLLSWVLVATVAYASLRLVSR